MDVSIIIVSFNAASYLKECLESILEFSKEAPEIIVVDNNSRDNSVEVAKEFKNVRVMVNKDNRGYAAGVNTGLKKASGDYILILNPDIRFLDDAISKMKAFMGQNPGVGLASCTLLDAEQRLLPNGGYFPTLTRLFAWAFFIRIPQAYHPKTTSDPDWVTGSFMFVRREVVEKVGVLDENIFMYGEEVEWQYRIRDAGWKIGYTPTAKVIHYERQSSGGSPRNAILGEFKGLKYIYGKHFPGWKQIILGTLLDVAAFLRIFFWLVRRRPDVAKVYLEALLL